MATQDGEVLLASTQHFHEEDRVRSELGEDIPGERLVELVLPDEFGESHQVLYLTSNRVKSPTRVVVTLTSQKTEENRGCLLGLFGRRKLLHSST